MHLLQMSNTCLPSVLLFLSFGPQLLSLGHVTSRLHHTDNEQSNHIPEKDLALTVAHPRLVTMMTFLVQQVPD